MKHAIVVISVVCLWPIAKAEMTKDSETEILELEMQRFRAIEKVDVATLNRILSDDLIYAHSTGLQQTKDELIGVLGSGDMKYESITPSEVRVRTYTSTAVVTGRAAIKIKAHGEERSLNLCYLDVYVKQEGRWQMVAWQSSRLAP
jgi:ketosteroid isomerase-like protein